MRYIFVIITLLGLSSCLSTSSSSMYPIEKGKSEHGLTILGTLNLISYTSRYGVSDNLEFDSHIGLFSIGGNLKYHLYKDKTEVLSLNIGFPSIFIFETGLSYSMLESKSFGTRFSIKYQYLPFSESKDCSKEPNSYLSECRVERNLHLLGGTVTFGGSKFWLEAGYMFTINKTSHSYTERDSDDSDEALISIDINEAFFHFILKVGIAF